MLPDTFAAHGLLRMHAVLDDTRPLTLVRFPDPSLQVPSYEVVPSMFPHFFLSGLAARIDAFTKENSGYSMAGVQVGVPLRFFWLIEHPDLIRYGGYRHGFWVNPRIVSASDAKVYNDEACLSMLNGFDEVYRKKWHKVVKLSRPSEVTVECTDPATGEVWTQHCKGLLARVVQHEIDHLDGILFHTRLNSMERQKFDPWLREMSKGKS
jgi:peptide deformylase